MEIEKLSNKEIFAKNLEHFMVLFCMDRAQICRDLKIKYSTFSEWINAKKYPRIDKIEMLANYFRIPKSALIEPMDYYPNYPKSITLLDDEQKLLEVYRNLNYDGQNKIKEYAVDIAQNKKYVKNQDKIQESIQELIDETDPEKTRYPILLRGAEK